MKRLLWRLGLIWHTKSLAAWKWTKFIDHRPLTEAEIERGRDIAKELGLEIRD